MSYKEAKSKYAKIGIDTEKVKRSLPALEKLAAAYKK